jgi:hypothetical protein
LKRLLAVSVLALGALMAQQASEQAGSRAILFSAEGSLSSVKPFTYYMAKLDPTGHELRVSTQEIFQSQSTAYLYVTANVSGHVVVFVQDDPKATTASQYYPKPNSSSGGVIHKGEALKVPIQFDSNPGKSAFTVALLTETPESTALIAAVQRKQPDAYSQIRGYIKPGGKGVSPLADDSVVTSGPIHWATFSLTNR